MEGESDGAAGGGAQGPPSPLSARPPRGRLTLALARCPPRETGAPRRSLPHGSSVCRGWASWGSVPSRVDARVGRRPLPSVWLSLAASRRCRPARCAPRSAHGRPRRRPACVCRPCGPHSVWLDLGSRGVRDRHFQPARCWGRGRAGARRRPEEREGGLGTVRSVALPAPPGSPPRPGGVRGGVGCQSQSRAPEGPGRPGDVPAHALQAPPQAQVPRGQQGEPTAQLLPLLSCHTDVIFL